MLHDMRMTSGVFVLFLIFVCCCFPSSAAAHIMTISIEPANPTTMDDIMVKIEGEFPNGCWGIDDIQCGSLAGDSIAIDLSAVDVWTEGTSCVQVIVNYTEECILGSLPPGCYKVNVTEYHESLRDPVPDMLSFDFCVDSVTVTGVVLDIKPGSCKNPLNVKNFDNPDKNGRSNRGGVLPVAILGSPECDVMDIDVSSLLLEGVVPLRYGYEDIATVAHDDSQCACPGEGADGYIDLTLKFDKSNVVAALGPVSDGEQIPLILTGSMHDGTSIEGVDCVTILGEKSHGKHTAEGRIRLHGAAPNPFNPVTRIAYYLPADTYMELAIFDTNGRLVEVLTAGFQSAGDHFAEWQAENHASGIYYCRLKAGGETSTRKMVLLK